MTEATIRIEASVPGGPKGGLAGALTGGQEEGGSQAIELDLRGADPGTIALNIDRAAEAYRLAFFGERSSEAFIDEHDQAREALQDIVDREEASLEPKPQGTRTVTTTEELDALPLGTFVLDRDYDGYRRVEAGWSDDPDSDSASIRTSAYLARYVPLYVPSQGGTVPFPEAGDPHPFESQDDTLLTRAADAIDELLSLAVRDGDRDGQGIITHLRNRGFVIGERA